MNPFQPFVTFGQNAILQISEQPQWITVINLPSAKMNMDEKHNNKTVIACLYAYEIYE